MPQYTNPLEALRKAQTIGPVRPKTPYERTFMENPYEMPPDAPPKPDIAAAFGVSPQNTTLPRRSTYGDIPGIGASAIEGLQGAMGTGLEFKAPYVRPGAGTPQQAISTFQASQPPPQERFTPSIAEMFQLASRENVPIPGEKGLEYGVAPGASEYWKSRLGLRLGEEQFQTPEAQAAREMEMYKMGGPERTARVTGEYDVAQQREASRGAVEAAQTKGAIQENIWDMLGKTNVAGGPGAISRMSVPGAGSVSFAQERPVPTALSQQVLAAKSAYLAANDRTFGGAEREKAIYDHAVAQAVSAHPSASSKAKQLIIETLTDPTTMDLPIDDFDLSEFAPSDQKAIVDILLNVRGS